MEVLWQIENELTNFRKEATKREVKIVELNYENERLSALCNRLQEKINRLENERHVYKLEMNRLRRKLTRIYEFVNEAWRDCPSIVAIFKNR